jgi:Brp/Blh family beta-carotene 15,15'-monooxygenase
MKSLVVQIVVGIISILVYLVIPDGINAIQYVFLGLVLLIVGIPHGAMDHVIDGAVNDWKPDSFNLKFYSMYLGLIAVYSVFWYFFPLISMVIFLLITSYHFGQADTQRFNLSGWPYWSMLIVRGLSLLVLLLFGDLAYASSIIETITSYDYESSLLSIISTEDLMAYWVGITSGSIIFALYASKKPIKLILVALLENVILIAMFNYVNVVIAFSLYFGLWHSFEHVKVMAAYLFTKGEQLSLASFYKQSFTFSMLSYLGLLFIYNLLDAFGQTELMVGLLLVLISVLTLPHLVVVEQLFQIKKADS